jgi:hypothetical protein
MMVETSAQSMALMMVASKAIRVAAKRVLVKADLRVLT